MLYLAVRQVSRKVDRHISLTWCTRWKEHVLSNTLHIVTNICMLYLALRQVSCKLSRQCYHTCRMTSNNALLLAKVARLCTLAPTNACCTWHCAMCPTNPEKEKISWRALLSLYAVLEAVVLHQVSSAVSDFALKDQGVKGYSQKRPST